MIAATLLLHQTEAPNKTPNQISWHRIFSLRAPCASAREHHFIGRTPGLEADDPPSHSGAFSRIGKGILC